MRNSGRRARKVAVARCSAALLLPTWGCNALAGIDEPAVITPSPLDDDSGSDASAGQGAEDADEGATANGGESDGRLADGASDARGARDSDSAARDGADGAPAVVALDLTVTRDVDDCTWIINTDGITEERLHYDADSLYGEVGADHEAGRIGLRFVLPIAKGATIVSATLELHRVISMAATAETMQAQVFDSSAVPAFDATHMHAPSGHAAVWATAIRGIGIGTDGMPLTTPDLSALVQHVINRSDWAVSGAMGFVLSPDVMASTHWVDYADSSLGIGQPTLHLRYTR